MQRKIPPRIPGFKITSGKGFHITFDNRYTVSVQFGGGNYCDNYDDDIGTEPYIQSGKKGSGTAECAVWGPDGEMLKRWSDTVSNRSTPAEVLDLLKWAECQPVSETAHD